MVKKNWSIFTFLVAIALFVSACSSDSSTKEAGESDSTSGDEKTVVIGLEAEPTSMDAHQLSDFNTSRAAMELYDQLVQFKDGSTELEPDLAEKWDISEDGLE